MRWEAAWVGRWGTTLWQSIRPCRRACPRGYVCSGARPLPRAGLAPEAAQQQLASRHSRARAASVSVQRVQRGVPGAEAQVGFRAERLPTAAPVERGRLRCLGVSSEAAAQGRRGLARVQLEPGRWAMERPGAAVQVGGWKWPVAG